MSLGIPLTVQFEITNQCNLRCLHCYHMDSLVNASKNKDLSDELAVRIMQRFIDYKVFGVAITGGEPLSRKSLLMRLSDMVQGTDTTLSVNTNLLLLDEEILSSSLSGFLVSCVSSDPATYELMTQGGRYALFEKNLVKLLTTNKYVLVNMVVSKRNVRQIRQTISWMAELGVKRFAASPMTIGSFETTERFQHLSREEVRAVIDDLAWAQDTHNLSVDVLDALPKCVFSKEILQRDFRFLKRACSLANGSLQISNRGFARPCPNSDEVYGNVLEESLDEIYARMSHLRCDSQVPEECKSCVALFDCRGGCRVQAFKCTNDLCGRDPWMAEPFAALEDYPRAAAILPKPISATTRIRFPASTVKWRKEIGSALGEDSYTLYNPEAQGHVVLKRTAMDFLSDVKRAFPDAAPLESIATHYGWHSDNPKFLTLVRLLASAGFAQLE